MNKEDLINRYWAGETSLEEEKWLRENHEGAIFEFQRNEQQLKSQLNFDQLMQTINQETPVEKVRPRLRVFSLNQWIPAIAACLIILAGAFFIMRSDSGPSDQALAMVEDSYEDPMQAYEEVREALMLVSSKINQTSTEVATHISKAEPYSEIFK